MLCSAGNEVAELRDTLQLENSVIGSVFLLDRGGRIRWKAHSSPTQLEIRSLLSCSEELLLNNCD